MKLGMQVGLGLANTALDGDPAPPRKEVQQPPLSKFAGARLACVRIIRGPCLFWPNGWMDQDKTWIGDRPRPWPHCVRWGSSSPPPKGHSPNFRPMSAVAKLSRISATGERLYNCRHQAEGLLNATDSQPG